ncbi:MAG: class I SAM-dependent methyltransferase [Phycisphaerae bacterium]|nr:class I SAM-dependent methyltransferase [Phycisphaerae bacterium]
MVARGALPAEFLRHIEALEESFLQAEDPIRQSGFGGGPDRWRAEREPILDAVEGDGDLLDVGCANGYLLECLVGWGRQRGLTLMPFGLDLGARLIGLARRRLPEYASNFFVGNAWDWEPGRRFRYVYSLYDCVPVEYLREYARRLLDVAVEPGGRLIMGAYGSRSRCEEPFGIAEFLRSSGLEVAGTSHGGDPSLTEFAWVSA